MTIDDRYDLTKPASDLLSFVQDRDWEGYQSSKNLLLALIGEVGELAELFQWLTDEEADQSGQGSIAEQVRHEVADVQLYLLRMCQVLDIDLRSALAEKLELNRRRYPVMLSRGRRTKYTQLSTTEAVKRA